jgi:hypothetical protein
VPEGKPFRRDAPLFFAGEADGLGVVEVAVLVQGPIDEFFKVLERVAIF